MYKDKKCIGIIFDPSYHIYRIDIPMNKIFEILSKNLDAHFIYGGIKRLTDHVEEYARNLKIKDEQLHFFCIPAIENKGFMGTEQASRWLTEVLSYSPDVLYVFRDNRHAGLTTMLVRSCMDIHIQVIEYDNRGMVTRISPEDTNYSQYYTTRPGEIYYKNNKHC